jgi:hypothetical protein
MRLLERPPNNEQPFAVEGSSSPGSTGRGRFRWIAHQHLENLVTFARVGAMRHVMIETGIPRAVSETMNGTAPRTER